MLNKKPIFLFTLFAIFLIGCDDPLKQNYLDRKSTIEVFLSYDDVPSYYYEIKDAWLPENFNDENGFILNTLKSNLPREISIDEYKKSCENRVIEDINSIMVSYTGVTMSPKYAFTLLSDYTTCLVEVVDTTYISQSSTRYYSLDKAAGEQIYDFVRKQLRIHHLKE